MSSTIIPKKKLCKCGCGELGYIWARGFIKGHENKGKVKKIKKVSDKQKSRIIANKSYYAQEIARHMEENKGQCPCENCGVEIINPSGRNVSHIISGSANSALYHHPLNRFILCHDCERIWTNEDKTKLKIYHSSEERMIDLKNFYYTTMMV